MLPHLLGGDLSGGRVDDEHEPVHGYQQDGEAREEDAGGLGGPDQFTEVLHVLAQRPVLRGICEKDVKHNK